jgi:hypothetical protein
VIDAFLEILTRTPLRSLDEGRDFFGLLDEMAPDWLPGRWGHNEPLSHTYSRDQLEKAWSDDLLWRGGDAPVEGMVARPYPQDRYGTIHLGIDSGRLDVDRAILLFERLGLRFDAAYGYLHLVTPREKQGSAPGSIEYLTQDKPHLFVAEHRLRRWLPDLYWANLLGPPYVELFGADRIASAPANTVEQIGPALFYVQLSAHLDDLRNHFDEVAEVRRAVKHYLGENAFWNASLGEEHDYDVAVATAT